jgi:hypothetical protein
MMHKVLCTRLWWLSIFVDAKEYCKWCGICQCIRKPYHIYELPLFSITIVESFDMCYIEFMGPIIPLERQIGSGYIITITEYLTRWSEATHVKDCTAKMVA